MFIATRTMLQELRDPESSIMGSDWYLAGTLVLPLAIFLDIVTSPLQLLWLGIRPCGKAIKRFWLRRAKS